MEQMTVSPKFPPYKLPLDSQHTDGWIYTNDARLDPRPLPLEDWKTPTGGMTRRRRWTHRIYYTGSPTDIKGFEFE